MDKTIENLSNETIETIKNRSAYKLPNNPSERGFKTEDIKGAFWRAEFDGEMSIMGQLKKIVDRLNQILPQTLDNTQIVDNCVTADPSKVASANQLVVLKGLIDSASNEMLDIKSNVDNQDLTINSLGTQIDEVESSLSNITSTVQENAGNIESLNNEITNLTQTSGLLYKDDNGVLRCGDIVVPQQKTLVSSADGISVLKSGVGYQTIFTDSKSIYNRHFRILISLFGKAEAFYIDFKTLTIGMKIYHFTYKNSSIYPAYVKVNVNENELSIQVQYETASDYMPIQAYVYELTEIFE